MPHKVNPIDFENAEANLGIANALFRHLSEKLPASRLQRDLSDSSAQRNLGSAIGYSCVALDSVLKGLSRLEVNEGKIEHDLGAAWEILGEGLQTVMRRARCDNPYERMKDLTRGTNIDEETICEIIAAIPVRDEERARLRAITPRHYVGKASELVSFLADDRR